MQKHWRLFVSIFLLALPGYSADVLFGRRIYAAQGRTYQQIWMFDSHTNKTVPLTNTPRRHLQPVCSPDGRKIWFLSGVFGDEKNTELWSFDPQTRTETLAVRVESDILRLLGGTNNRAFFTAIKESDSFLYRWDGHLTKLSPLSATALDSVALSPDDQSLAVPAADQRSVTMMEVSGAKGHKLNNCSNPLWSADGKKLACTAGQTVRVLDLATGVETGHADFLQRQTPPAVADFSPDGTKVLVKTVGANHSSTYPQSDYWVLEMAQQKWTFAGAGQSAIFITGKNVLLVTPRELSAVGQRHDWVSQLLLVDPVTHAQTPVAAGTTNNVEPCRCTHLAVLAEAKPVVRKSKPNPPR
jgi:WD40 repeat protein